MPRPEIDDLYINRPYYILPDGKVGVQAFGVIREAMRKKGMVAIGRVVLSTREHIIALEARDAGMLGMLLHYPYEVRKPEEYFEGMPEVDTPKEMIDLATHIIDTMAGHFDPAKFEDRYETAMRDLIDRKQAGAIFRLYLECGSIGVLAEELARRNVVSKVRTFASGRVKGGGPYSVGALAHFLKNRFYLGEVVYRGETHSGEHKPIVDRACFDAVQAKLAEKVRARRVRLNDFPAILMGRIFDDRGNRMTPNHSNKDGVRYRYYVSHVLLQHRKRRPVVSPACRRSSWRSLSSRRSRHGRIRSRKAVFPIAV